LLRRSPWPDTKGKVPIAKRFSPKQIPEEPIFCGVITLTTRVGVAILGKPFLLIFAALTFCLGAHTAAGAIRLVTPSEPVPQGEVVLISVLGPTTGSKVKGFWRGASFDFFEIDEEKYSGSVPPNTHGEYVWQGVYVYDISSEQGLVLRGRITHLKDDEELLKSGFYFESSHAIKRSLYIDNVLYTISENTIKMNDIENLAETNTIDLS